MSGLTPDFFCITCKAGVDPSYKACPYCGEPITDFLRQYLVNPIDGKYKIISRLGIGGMGEVYKVLHLRLNSVRVVKMMRAKLQESDAEARFVREARLATRIQHQNVATLFDFSALEDGTHYMVWEYIEGTNLAEMLRVRGPLPAGECARICIQALDGLDAIHRAGIVHRDISPENIMITPTEEGSPRVKLIDLGIAKHSADASEDQTKTGMFVGKWKYCSPEHFGFLDPGEAIDARADIYSFGIVMYELLTGRPPFVAQSPQQYLLQHSSTRPPELAEIDPGLRNLDALQAVIFKALEKKRSDRWADAAQFRRALENILPSLPEIGEVETLAGNTPIPKATLIEAPAELRNAVPFDKRVLAPEPSASTTETTVDEQVPGEFRPPKRELGVSKIIYGGLAAVVVIAVIAGVLITRSRNEAADEKPPASQAGLVQPAGATLSLNAYPWAEITRVTSVADQRNMLTSRVVTPAAVPLPAGEYEIEALNPQSGGLTVQRVKISPNERAVVMLQFAGEQNVGLPEFIEAVR